MKRKLLQRSCGHYYKDAYYSPYCNDKLEIKRQEAKANKGKCTTLVTKEALKKAKEKGLDTFYEIAEELCVREETVQYAYNYYRDNQCLI